MANIKIAQLTNQINIADTDLMLIESATSTNKMTVGNLKELLGINAKASKTQPAWTDLVLLNGWTNYGGDPNQTGPSASFFKDEMGFVHLRGLIKGGALNTVIFNLPAGCRPSAAARFVAPSSLGYGQIDISMLGDAVCSVGSLTDIDLSNCYFKAV